MTTIQFIAGAIAEAMAAEAVHELLNKVEVELSSQARQTPRPHRQKLIADLPGRLASPRAAADD